MKRFLRALVVSFLLGTALLPCTGTSAEKGEALGEGVKKKLISFGNSGFTPANVEKNLRELEDVWMPGYDGVNIIAHKKVLLSDGKTLDLDWKWFSKTKWKKEWFTKEIESLRNIHKNAKKFKYNFLDTSAHGPAEDFDLFDDEFWDTVCNNFQVMAFVAKQGGCAGIRFDLEDYGNQKRFLYRTECGHTYEESWEMARKRGRQWMNAVAREYPDIRLFCFFWLDLMFGFADGTPDTKGRLEACPNGLLVAFINGIYDVLPPGAKILDGMESNGYAAKTFTDFCYMRGLRDARYKRLLAPENHRKLREQTSLAVATYLTAYYDRKSSPDGFDTKSFREKSGLSQLDFFRRNLSFAIDFSDEFSWTYNGFLRKYSPIPSTHAYQEKNLQKSPEVPSPYIGMALPGIEEAIAFAKNPYAFAMERVKTDKNLKNLLLNGDFEDSSAKKKEDIPVAPACVEVKNVPHWIFYKSKASAAVLEVARGMGIDKGTAVRLTGQARDASIHANVPVRQGKVYVVRAVCKRQGKGGGILRIQWKSKEGRWHNHAMTLAAPYNEDLGNGWRRATLFVREVPENSAYLCPLLTYTGTGREDAILLDKAEVFSIFEGEAVPAPHLEEPMKKWREKRAASLKEEFLKIPVKVSKPAEGEKIPKGVFCGKNVPVSEKALQGGILLCKADFECGADRKSPGKFFKAVGKNAGYSDDTCGLIRDGNGYFIFHVRNVKAGEKYTASVKVKKSGGGKVLCKVQYSSPKKKGPFDYSLGVPLLKEKKELENSWTEYSGSFTVPEGANKFAVIVSFSGLKEADMCFVDDVSARRTE